jgi:CO/xanthine dehydrogenase Mo-binding subunit
MSEKIVGHSVRKADGPEKVTGEARFVDDFSPGGMLHAFTVRSPFPHCKILGIDCEAARSLPGVHAVLTHEDVPGRNRIPIVFDDHPVLAEGVARFIGEPMALVAAETPEIARQAAALVELDLEELPFVEDMDEAMNHPEIRVYGTDNIFKAFDVVKGDIEVGFAEADLVLEHTYDTGYQDHAYLECQGMIASPDGQGSIKIMGSMQCPYYILDAVSMALGLPKNKVRVVQTPTGGAFGGKEDVPSIPATHAALLSWVTRRPVKLIYNREEDLTCMSKRHPGRTTIRLGAKKDGTFTACKVHYRIDGGAYSTLSPVVLFRGIAHAVGPYDIPNVTVLGQAAATHTVPNGAYRGFGQPQVLFAAECMVDEMAHALDIDPVELRLKNALRPGSKTSTGQEVTESCGLVEAMEKVREASNYTEIMKLGPQSGPRRRAIGFSASHYGVSLGAAGNHLDRAGAHLQIQKDGAVLVAIGNTEVGQGARTVIGQITAEGLGCHFENVHMLDTDTTRVPDSGPTVASRTTVMSGNAILDACRLVRESLLKVAAEELGGGCTPEQIRMQDGVVHCGDEAISWEELITACYQKRAKVSAQGWFVSPPAHMDEFCQGDVYVCYTYSANAVEIELDLETGEVDLLWCTSAHDIGRVINPQQAQGQVEGGNLQGLGYALYEHMPRQGGKLSNTSFAGYILPTAADAPRYRSILIEKPWDKGPFGAKGLGEPPLIGMAPAVANAIRNACGARMDAVPMLPEHIWKKIQELEARS